MSSIASSERHQETWTHSVLCRDGAWQHAAVLTAFLNSSMVARIHSIYSLSWNKQPKKGHKTRRSPCREGHHHNKKHRAQQNTSHAKIPRGWLALPCGMGVPIGANVKLQDTSVDQPSVCTIPGLRDQASYYCGSVKPVYKQPCLLDKKISTKPSHFQLASSNCDPHH